MRNLGLNTLICVKNVFFYNDSFHLGAKFFLSFLKKACTKKIKILFESS